MVSCWRFNIFDLLEAAFHRGIDWISPCIFCCGKLSLGYHGWFNPFFGDIPAGHIQLTLSRLVLMLPAGWSSIIPLYHHQYQSHFDKPRFRKPCIFRIFSQYNPNLSPSILHSQPFPDVLPRPRHFSGTVLKEGRQPPSFDSSWTRQKPFSFRWEVWFRIPCGRKTHPLMIFLYQISSSGIFRMPRLITRIQFEVPHFPFRRLKHSPRGIEPDKHW